MGLFDHVSITTLFIGAGLIYSISRLSKIGSREPHLPPGPPTHPIIGNLAIIPTKKVYLTFMKWAKTYGDVFSLKIGSQTLIIVSSFEAANEILERNAAVTSDRAPFAPALRFGPTGNIALTPYGPGWKKMKKARSAVSVMFSTVGGVRIPFTSSPLRDKFFHIYHLINEVTEPGHTPPVDLIPILNYLPDRFAMNWKARCDAIRQQLDDVLHVMVTGVEQRLREGRSVGCHLELMLQNAEEWQFDRPHLLGTVVGLILAGAISSASHLHWIVLLASANPDVQRKLHEELDRVVGDERSPTMEDLPHLPYLNAFIKEVHRFRPNVPLNLPHLVQEDIWYEGKLIPKGSQVLFNLWDAFRNPKYYDDPDRFDPDRFIRSPYGTKPGLENHVNVEALKKIEMSPYGWGKRRCAGMPMAIETGALSAAHLFWTFEFSGYVDENGVQLKPDVDAYNVGLSSDPLPFKSNIKTRSSH
ncbi:hypothetical protein FRC02_004656, partial [Tulasnella sp. 418]